MKCLLQKQTRHVIAVIFVCSAFAFQNDASASCSATGGNFVCAGASPSSTVSKTSGSMVIVDVTNTYSAPSLSLYNLGSGGLSITSAGNITGKPGSDGLVAVSSGALSFNQTGGFLSAGTSGSNGVQINGNGAGDLTLDFSGTVTSGSNSGVLTTKHASGNQIINVTSTGIISGQAGGVDARNFATGSTTTITSAGSISSTGLSSKAISGNASGAFFLSQTGGTIAGHSSGIYVTNSGEGVVGISTEGTVTGTTDYGVYASQSSVTNSSILSISQSSGTISGGSFGIYASHAGLGAVNITTAGTVGGVTSGYGLYAELTQATNSSAITVTQSSGTISGIDSGISINNTGTGSTLISTAGSIAGGTGAGIMTVASPGKVVAITLNNGANVSAASGTAIFDTEGAAIVTMESGSSITGRVLLGNGSDAMIVRGSASLSGATLLDGGDSLDGTVSDVLGTAGAATNKLTFDSTSQSLGGSTLKNWQTVTVNDGSLTFLNDASLVTGSGVNSDSTLQGLVLTNGSTLSSPVLMAIVGDVFIDGSSSLSHAFGGSITGNLTNYGLVYWQNLGKTLTINGNYTGVVGSRISLETWLAGDSSTTDKLHVTGNTSGTTAIAVRVVAASPGAQTVDGIQVVQVDGVSAAGSFSLASPVQAGAYEYVLRQGGAVSGGQSWYLTSVYNCSLDNSCPVVVPTPAILRPGVANYITGQLVNLEQGFLQIGSYHQRVGGQYNSDGDGLLTWFRPYHMQLSADGATQFGYAASFTGLQFGKELLLKRDGFGGAERVAVTFDYGMSSSDSSDRMRPLAGLSASTGSLGAESFALGGTYSKTYASDAYIDLVSQVSLLRNEFTDSYGGTSSQNALRFSASVELGDDVACWHGWILEPQAQLSYMHTRYQSFSDSTSRVNVPNGDAWRVRLGARVYHSTRGSQDHLLQYYGIANLLRDIRPASVSAKVGDVSIQESFNRKRGEVGVGVLRQWSRSARVYADARYMHSLGGVDAHGFELNTGIKIDF